jgi:adenosine/AMP kinase
VLKFDLEAYMNTEIVAIYNPDEINLILGQSHFIKTVEDLHETLVSSVPGIKFGLAFCEASTQRLVRWSGTDDALIELAKQNALLIGAGHSFIIFLGQGYFPINVLNQIKLVPEICHIFCATANTVQVVIAETDLGRGILGVIDGQSPRGVESDAEIADRKALLRRFGYKA